jgi:hypothetical protein
MVSHSLAHIGDCGYLISGVFIDLNEAGGGRSGLYHGIPGEDEVCWVLIVVAYMYIHI